MKLPLSFKELSEFLIQDITAQDSVNYFFAGLPNKGGVTSISKENVEKHWNHREWLPNTLGHIHSMRLDGETRLRLTDIQPAGDLLAPPANHLMRLFQDEARRKELTTLVKEAFGSWLVIDPTKMGHLRLRLSERPPQDGTEEQNWDLRAREFHKSATPIEEMSDGVKAYTGILSSVLSSHRRLILLDEPEAFLHPPLAKKLGKNIARIARENKKSLFVATHSAPFLLGCVESGVPTTVVRLTYSHGVASVRHIPSNELLELMKDPLLRSSSVVSALFHSGAIVTESATDRAFYEEVNSRLLDLSSPEGAADTVFLHAQNKQTIRRILRPLRALGIPVGGIVDLDVVKDGGHEWSELLESAGIPKSSEGSLSALRASVRDLLYGKNETKKYRPINTLNTTEQDTCFSLIKQMAEYGIFIVPRGEVENWLPNLSIEGKGPQWLIKMFEHMGADSADRNYLHPTNDDVWNFLREIGDWLSNTKRKGIPEAIPTATQTPVLF